MKLKFAQWQGGPSTVQSGQQPIYIDVDDIMGIYVQRPFLGFTLLSVRCGCECRPIYVSGHPEDIGRALGAAREGTISEEECDELTFNPVTTTVTYPMDDPENAAQYWQWVKEVRKEECQVMRQRLNWLRFQWWHLKFWWRTRGEVWRELR